MTHGEQLTRPFPARSPSAAACAARSSMRQSPNLECVFHMPPASLTSFPMWPTRSAPRKAELPAYFQRVADKIGLVRTAVRGSDADAGVPDIVRAVVPGREQDVVRARFRAAGAARRGWCRQAPARSWARRCQLVPRMEMPPAMPRRGLNVFWARRLARRGRK